MTDWTPQRSEFGGGTSFRPSVCFFQNQMVAAWKGINDDQRMFWSYTEDIATDKWSAQRFGPTGSTNDGPALCEFEDRLVALWKNGNSPQMFYSYLDKIDGGQWSPPVPGPGGGTSTLPALGFYNNRLYAMWKGLGTDQRLFYSSLDTIGGAWTPQQFGPGGGEGGTSAGPALCNSGLMRDNRHRLIGMWKGQGVDAGLYWAYFDGNWGPYQEFHASFASSGPALAWHNFSIYAAWRNGSDGRMFYAAMDPNFNNWTTPQQLSNGTTSVGPSLANWAGRVLGAEHSVLYAVWQGDHQQMQYSTRDDVITS
jgi:hypothetical protein